MSGTAKRLAQLTALASLLSAGAAQAQYQESPQHIAVELKLGPYVPHVDDSSILAGRTPFSDHYGDQADIKGALPPRGLLTQVEVDYQFWHKFGVLGIGLESGYFNISAPSFVEFPNTGGSGTHGCQVTAGVGGQRLYSTATKPVLDYYQNCISGDSDKLNVVPIALMLVYRFDVLSKRLRVPIIPYMKVGFAYYVWWFGNSNSLSANYTSAKGDQLPTAGGSPGIVLHPGISIDLSAIDQHAARLSDQEIGLNRIAAFVELNAVLVDGFDALRGNSSRSLNMSDTSLLAGLSFEF